LHRHCPRYEGIDALIELLRAHTVPIAQRNRRGERGVMVASAHEAIAFYPYKYRTKSIPIHTRSPSASRASAIAHLTRIARTFPLDILHAGATAAKKSVCVIKKKFVQVIFFAASSRRMHRRVNRSHHHVDDIWIQKARSIPRCGWKKIRACGATPRLRSIRRDVQIDDEWQVIGSDIGAAGAGNHGQIAA
jgi:hypothetical protein